MLRYDRNTPERTHDGILPPNDTAAMRHRSLLSATPQVISWMPLHRIIAVSAADVVQHLATTGRRVLCKNGKSQEYFRPDWRVLDDYDCP